MTLTTHFTLHGELCVLGMALWTKVPSQRQTWTATALQVTRRHEEAGTVDGENLVRYTKKMCRFLLTPC